jgi:predicted GNAT family N-acyltransferase
MLRELRKDDYMDYLLLLKQLNGMEPNMTKEMFWLKYQLIKQNGGIIYICETKDILVGTVKVLHEVKFYDDIVHIEDVVVDSKCRKQGVGKMMMKEVMTIIPECYKAVIECDVNLFDFYMSCGFDLQGHSFVKRLK